MQREHLRATFTEAAELYDRMRPKYPDALFDDLAELAHLHSGARVLEIGCGTGQATRPLARRGYAVTAVELGAEMAAVASARLAEFPNVEIVVGSFEEWPLPAQPFDALVSATAFHWVDPAIRVSKSAAALRPGGSLAIVRTHHVRGGTSVFFDDAQRCYERWDPATPPDLRLEPAEDIPIDTDELDASPLFEPAVVRRYPWTVTYTAGEYHDVLMTYSGHRALESTARAGLLDCINQLIETRYGGQITKQYLAELVLAVRKSD